MFKVFLSSAYQRRMELHRYRADLQRIGFEVNSSWLDPTPLEEEDEEIASPILAAVDLNDLIDCDILINFTEPPRSSYSRGGRHVELGMAYAYDKMCIIVGPKENVYSYLPEIAVFDSWNDCVEWLTEIHEDSVQNQVESVIE